MGLLCCEPRVLGLADRVEQCFVQVSYICFCVLPIAVIKHVVFASILMICRSMRMKITVLLDDEVTSKNNFHAGLTSSLLLRPIFGED